MYTICDASSRIYYISIFLFTPRTASVISSFIIFVKIALALTPSVIITDMMIIFAVCYIGHFRHMLIYVCWYSSFRRFISRRFLFARDKRLRFWKNALISLAGQFHLKIWCRIHIFFLSRYISTVRTPKTLTFPRDFATFSPQASFIITS